MQNKDLHRDLPSVALYFRTRADSSVLELGPALMETAADVAAASQASALFKKRAA